MKVYFSFCWRYRNRSHSFYWLLVNRVNCSPYSMRLSIASTFLRMGSRARMVWGFRLFMNRTRRDTKEFILWSAPDYIMICSLVMMPESTCHRISW